MHESNSLNPYEGKTGFWNGVNRFLFRFAGPAQVGIGRPEEPYVPQADPRCPVCKQPLADHDVRRGDSNTRTYLNCPTP